MSAKKSDNPARRANFSGGGGFAGSGMIESNIHQGFAVQEMPMTFEDLKRLNGLPLV